MTWRSDDTDDEPPRPPPDPRTRSLIHPIEATIRRQRARKAVHTREHRPRTGPRRKRWAAEILADWGDPECPRLVVPSGELFREARSALGWNRPDAAWRLGFESRSSGSERIKAIEDGQTWAPRFARVLMVRALQDLDRQQRSMGGRR